MTSFLIGLNCTEELPTPSPDPNDTTEVLVLAPPFGLVADAPVNYNITLRWQDTSGYNPAFVIQRADTGGSFSAMDTVTTNSGVYVDSLPKDAHASFRYRLFSYHDTLVSVFTDTVTVALLNSPPVLEITNYDALVTKVFWLGDTVSIKYTITDADSDTVKIDNPDSQVVFQGNSIARYYVNDTIPDTVEFICSDNFGGSDSATVVFKYFDVNYTPVFNSVTLPEMSIVGQRAKCGYSVTDADNDDVTIFVDSIYSSSEDPRKIELVSDDTLFSFIILPGDVGNTPHKFIAQDPHKERDTITDTFFVVENSILIYNTIKHDTTNRLAQYNVDGASGRYIATTGGDSIGYPVLSPNNGKIVYSIDIGDTRDIHSINTDGTWDNTLFSDAQKVFIPGSWSSDSSKVAFRMLVPDSSTWSIVIYDINTAVLDTVYEGIPMQGVAYGPVYTSDDSVFIYANNDSLYSLSLSQGLTGIAANASHPQVLHASSSLYYASTASGSKLIKSGLSGQGAVAVADFGDYSVDYIAADQTRQIVYGLAIKGSGANTDTYGWVYFEKYDTFVKINLEIEESW